MRYEIEIHKVWLPVTREQAEQIFSDWEFNIPGTSHLESGLHRLDSLGPGEQCRIMSGHVRFRRVD